MNKSTENQPLLAERIKNFKINHYKNLDTDAWFDEVNSLHKKFLLLKDPDKKSRVVFKLCHTYLQLLETLFINAHAVSLDVSRFPSALFINPKNLKNFVNDNFTKTTKFSSWFLTNYILSAQMESKDYKERYMQYSNMIQECAKDFTGYYPLLNAYKHGYRLNAKHGANSISLLDKSNKQHLLVEVDCQITYIDKAREDLNDGKVEVVIYEQIASFNMMRIFGKAGFAVVLLQNLKLITLAVMGAPQKERLMTITPDKEEWQKTFGTFNLKKPLFSLGVKSK